MYAEEITPQFAMEQLIKLLENSDINRRRANHTLLAKSYWVYDKEDWSTKMEKPLGLGLIYQKPDGTKTQDIFIAIPTGEIETYYKEVDMIKKYPSMEGVHKTNLPIK